MLARKTCPDCGIDRAVDDFHKNASRPDGLGFYCRFCATARHRAYVDRQRAAMGRPPQKPRRELVKGTKWCSDCGKALPLGQFAKNAANRDGLTRYCRTHHAARSTANVEKHHGTTRHFHLMRRYGISEREVDAMFERQGGLCAACGKKAAKHVDHDHETGKVRELLCFTCNVALGNVNDSIDTLQALITYLKKHRAKPLPAATTRQKITVRIPTHRDFRFTIPARVQVFDFAGPTLSDSAIHWADNVTYATRLRDPHNA